MAVQHADTTQTWGSDFFGTLNHLPPEPVAGLGGVLEAMRTLPAFHEARRWLMQALALTPGTAVLEAGCGTGVALPDLLAVVGAEGQVVGLDPTEAFVAAARERASRMGASHARYEVGDIRALPFAEGAFDAAFCDKVLIHAGPAPVAVRELARVTRPGGRVGVVEWLPFFALSTTRPEWEAAYNAMHRAAVYDYAVSANLARHFHAAALAHVQVAAFLAHADSLEEHPFWRAFLIAQLPPFVHAGLLAAETATALREDLEALNGRGEFSASFIVQAAVGTVVG